MLKQANKIFFLGIKGVAMSNIAVFLKKMGKTVAGCDTEEVFITDELLDKNGIEFKTGFSSDVLPGDADLFVYSAAHGGISNKLAIEAQKRGIPLISQADLIGEITKQFETTVAVAGCHGKTTTSSFLAYSLDKLGADPSYLVGVPFFTGHQGVGFKSHKYFVVEADEYGVNPPLDLTPKFHKLHPNRIVVTNIDFDHPDVYKNLEDSKTAYLKLLKNALDKGIKTPFVLRSDDANTVSILPQLPKGSYITTGFDEAADYRINKPRIEEDHSYFNLVNKRTGGDLGEFKVSITGMMNIGNSAQVVVTLIQLGFDIKKIKQAIVGFSGSERRFERKFKNDDYYLFDDYAHHPHEIETTIEASRERFPGRRVIVIFQPHTFTRTAALIDDFAKILGTADFTLLLPIFASAREDVSKFKITSSDIASKNKKGNIQAFKNQHDLLDKLAKTVRPGDIIFTMGAGDVYKMKDEIIRILDKGETKVKVEKDKDLYLYLTLKTHVTAEYFIDAKSRQDLIAAKKYSLANRLPLFLLGGGSNLAILKKKINGLVVKNDYRQLMVLEDHPDRAVISVTGGYPMGLLIAKTLEMGLEGFEYHQGLPGTAGGAVYMNSKWTKPMKYFGDDLVYAYLLDANGDVKKVNREYFQFAYDYSVLQKTKEIVLEAIFDLKKSDPKILKERAAWALDYRKKTQPFGIASSGCFFRNISQEEKEKLKIPTTSAGYLIDQCGLKGHEVGAFYVSPIHANFIVNRGGGKREDLIKLLEMIKTRVKEKYGVKLKEEVIII